MKKTLIKSLFVCMLLAVFIPVAVQAQNLLPATPYSGSLAGGFAGSTTNTPMGILNRILTILLTVAGIIALLYIIYGGFRYVTAGGNEEAAESAKHIIFNAIIGFAVIILAFVILKVVEYTVRTGPG